MLRLPRCRNCHRAWVPPEGAVASKEYCRRCSRSRKAAVKKALGLRPVSGHDLDGPYLLPRALRKRDGVRSG